MPPMSHTLAEEGAAILSFKLVKDGKFQVSIAAFVPGRHNTASLPVTATDKMTERLLMLVDRV